MYIHDPLTGLYNRRGFFQILSGVFAKRETNASLMVLSIDIDDLKTINDKFGHLEGDNAIKTVAKALSSISIRDEICARFGGDEFIVAGVNESLEYSRQFSQRFLEFIDYYNKHSDKPYQVVASIGETIGERKSISSIDELIAAADFRMYEQKAAHKTQSRQSNR
ncbi:MAG: GGDEF domain-containing protein [Oscillospiraceae bacterium]